MQQRRKEEKEFYFFVLTLVKYTAHFILDLFFSFLNDFLFTDSDRFKKLIILVLKCLFFILFPIKFVFSINNFEHFQLA